MQIRFYPPVATVFPNKCPYKGDMSIFSAWRQRPIFETPIAQTSDKPNSPWGSGNDDGEDKGPRNPWAAPPAGGRPRGAKPTALDEFMRRARGTGGGTGGGGGGFGGMPGGLGGRSLWLVGIVIIIGLWVAFTSFHIITPQQRGVVTLFGRYTNTLDPGFQFTLPAPIATVTKVDVQAIRTDDFPQEAGENLTLTGDQNIIDLAYSVRWDIADPQNYIYQIKDPRETVRATAESAMRAVIATVRLDDAIGAGRNDIEARVQSQMQSILDGYRSGVRVRGVAIKQADPPSGVVDDFKKVIAAQQEAQSNLNQANTYAQQVLARAQGEAAQFDKVYEQYRLAPEVTRRRMYYETMEAVLAKTNKTIVEAPGVVPYLPLPAQRGKVIAPEAVAPQGGRQ